MGVRALPVVQEVGLPRGDQSVEFVGGGADGGVVQAGGGWCEPVGNQWADAGAVDEQGVVGTSLDAALVLLVVQDEW